MKKLHIMVKKVHFSAYFNQILLVFLKSISYNYKALTLGKLLLKAEGEKL